MYRSMGGACCLHLPSLKTEAAHSSETSANNYHLLDVTFYNTVPLQILQWAPRTSDRLDVLRRDLLRPLWFRAAAELWHKSQASCSLHENMSNVHVTCKWPQPGVLSLYFELWYRLYYVVRTWGRQQVLPGWLAGRRAMPSSKRTNEHWNAGARHHQNEKQAKRATKQQTYDPQHSYPWWYIITIQPRKLDVLQRLPLFYHKKIYY